MCKNATKSAAALMAAIEPTIKSLLAATGQLNTPNGIAAMNAYDAALLAVQNWTPSTTAQNVLQLMNAFTAVFDTLPLPPNVALYVNIITAGITAVIAILTANSPAPASLLTHEETQAMHQAAVAADAAAADAAAADAAAKVAVLVPGFKRSIFHSPESQYNTAWNNACDTNPVEGIGKV
jgi:hypothetical protein